MNRENIKRLLHHQVSPREVYILCLIFLGYFCCLLFVFNAEGIAICNSIKEFFYGASNRLGIKVYITIIILFTTLFCLSGNLLISYIVMEIITISWGVANRIFYHIRDQFITIAEFDVLGEAADVHIDIELFCAPIIVESIIWGIINGLLIGILIRKIKKNQEGQNKKKYWFVRIGAIVLLCFSFIAIHSKQNRNVLDDLTAYKQEGCVVWFCQSLFGNTTEIVSIEEVQQIYNDFSEQITIDNTISAKRPNIIVIMSEAFWDTDNLNGTVETAENPMEKYNTLVADAITGQVAVNIFGGGTVVSEFEFLTGLNLRYLKKLNCFEAYYSNKQESLVTYLEELGYYSMAMHPYAEEYYHREMGYSNMGFDVYYSIDDFINRDKFHGYISDMSLTREIIERYEEHKQLNPGQPLFTFALSVQNHVYNMQYFDDNTGNEGCTDIAITIKGNEVDNETLDNVEEYYAGMNASLEALEELMNYFRECEEDTIIVFFGDHAPSFVKEICNTEGHEIDMNLYRTPYMIWTNYENDYQSYGDVSLAYLSTVLIDYLDFPKPNQYYLNRYMLEHYPINTKFEQLRLDTLDEQRLIDMMSILSTIEKRFSKEEMALPFWQIVK